MLDPSKFDVLTKKFRNTGGNVKKMYEILKNYQPKVKARDERSSSFEKNTKDSSNISINSSLKWNNSTCGQGLHFENGGQLVMLKEAAYVFRTAIGSTGFTSGQHYWEIIPDSRT